MTVLNRRAISLGLLLHSLPRGLWAQTDPLLQAAKAEGKLVSVGMPDHWANWGAVWRDLERLYGLKHVDTDMSSAEQIAKMEAERQQASVDIGDVGFEFGPIAKARGLTQAYKPSTWAQIPAWAKDEDGHWAVAYTGTIAFAVNRRLRPQVPLSWRALFDAQARVMIGAVGRAAQANAAVLAAAHALGGDERKLEPALRAFATLARAGKLVSTDPSPALMERAEAEVFLLWDFNALSFRERIPNPKDYEVIIPSDGSITSGYTTLINRHSRRPHAAKLAREFIFSDAGQTHLAMGRARPIRLEHLRLPEAAQRLLLPATAYQAARALRPDQWSEEVKKLPRAWQAQVLRAR